MEKNQKPVYLAPATESFMNDFDETFMRFSDKDLHTLILSVHTEQVYSGEVAGLQQFIMALQHQPHLIEKLVFCLELRFTSIEDSNIYIPESYWKADIAYYKWFHKLSACPVMLFFLNDEDARFYLLAGDMLAENLLELKDMDGRGRGMACLQGEELLEVMQRLFSACWMMLIYCHGTGFNPEPYIQSVLADLGLPITYEQVYEKYIDDVSKGINFRAIPVD